MNLSSSLSQDNISFENPGSVARLPDGWYFGGDDTTDVKTNVPVNGLGEWDPDKLVLNSWMLDVGRSLCKIILISQKRALFYSRTLF